MADQISGLALAVLLFPLFLWVPGAVLGYVWDILDFRSRPLPIQLALALLLSMAVGPILTYSLARTLGFSAALAFYGVLWTAGVVLAVTNHRQLLSAAADLVSHHKSLVTLCLLWVLVVTVSEIDFLSSSGVLRSLNAGDAVAHVAFTDALTRTGIPPVNPFIYPGYPVHLFYYYFWYMMCSLVDQLGGTAVSSRAAVQAGTVYVGFAMFSVTAVYVEFFGSILSPMRKLRTGVALALLTVTGLDLLPWILEDVLYRFWGKGSGAGLSIEWWNEQVTAWLGAIVMAPHHPAATAICFTSLLLVLGAVWKTEWRQKIWPLALAALGFASAAGVSLYVAFAFGAGLGIWILVAMFRGWHRYVWPFVLSGAAGGVLYLPFAIELRHSFQRAGLPVALTIRAFTPVDYWLPSIVRVLKHRPDIVMLLRLIFLPLNYFLELGFFFVSAFLFWKWRRNQRRALTPEEVLLTCIAAGSVLICTFLRSTFLWNDLGWRGFLVAQFVLLLWAVPVALNLLDRSKALSGPDAPLPAAWRPLVWICAVIGFAGTVGELGSMRLNFEGPHTAQTAGWRDAYIWVDRHTPQDAVLLLNGDVLDMFSSLYGHRQAVAAGRNYGTLYGVGVWSEKVVEDTVTVYRRDQPIDQLLALCSKYGATTVVVLSEDPIWNDHSSWVWKVKPSFSTYSARVFQIGDFGNPHLRVSGIPKP